ncbi:hypothetical protein ACO34A_14455 [Rhizobium sp. ACO-34A]|nr:hypothetical protein ACO34A_14455 [Rhizobium sp. ACO-34A]
MLIAPGIRVENSQLQRLSAIQIQATGLVPCRLFPAARCFEGEIDEFQDASRFVMISHFTGACEFVT